MYKVLVVDDEERICKGIKSMIKRMNHPEIGDVFHTYDGGECIKVAGQVKPNIIITDIRMPDIDGLSLIREFIRLKAEIKFIIISGYDEFLYAKEALNLGVIDYLLKPVSLEELKEALDKTVKSIKIQEQIREIHLNSDVVEDPSNQQLSETRIKSVIDIATQYIGINYYKYINLAIISNMVNMNYSYFSKLFKEQTGMSFVEHLTKVRMQEALKLLSNPTNKIQDISLRIGYNNPKTFTRIFKSFYGISPTEYKNKP